MHTIIARRAIVYSSHHGPLGGRLQRNPSKLYHTLLPESTTTTGEIFPPGKSIAGASFTTTPPREVTRHAPPTLPTHGLCGVPAPPVEHFFQLNFQKFLHLQGLYFPLAIVPWVILHLYGT